MRSYKQYREYREPAMKYQRVKEQLLQADQSDLSISKATTRLLNEI